MALFKHELISEESSFFRSITFRLIVIVGVFVLLFGSVNTVFTISKSKTQLVKQIQERQFAFSKYIANDINVEINKNLGFFTHLANQLSINNLGADALSANKLINENSVPSIFKYGIVIIPAGGKGVIAEYPVLPGRKELSFVQSEWFQRAKLANQAIFSKPFKNRITQEPSIVFAAPVKDDKKEVVAVVAGILALNQPKLFKYLYDALENVNANILVISPKDKLFISSSTPGMVLKPTPETGKNLLHDKAMKGYRGVGITVNAFGVEELAAITSIESTGWFVVVRKSTEEAFKPLNQLAKSLVVYNVSLIILLILIITVALVIMHSPLKKVTVLVRKMARGDIPLEQIPVAYKDEVGELVEGFNSLVKTVEDRTDQLEIANQKLSTISITDGLTGLGNRRCFDENLEQEWSRASRTQQTLALGMVDIDWFKNYNDHYGHQMGDECLKKVADVLSSTMNRTGDLTARYGGEEFAFIAPATDEDGIHAIAEKFRKALQTLALPHEKSEFGFVSVSIGVAVMIPTKEVEPKSLINLADKALYVAKRHGRNKVVISDE